METLKGIFPQSQPPPKRDFLKENVMRIRNIQRMRKPTAESEYVNRYGKPCGKPRKFSLSENHAPAAHRSTNSLALCSTKVPINNLRKSISSMSIQHQKEIGTQTVDTTDDFFLKDSIIRYPSASTVRSSARPPSVHQTQTCSRGHQMEPEETPRPRFRSHFHDRKDEHCDKMERHISNLSEFMDLGSISKKQPLSILKHSSSSTSSQKSNKNYINEFQRKESNVQQPTKQQTIDISDDEDDAVKDKLTPSEKELEAEEIKKQQLQAAEDDPDCPEGHMPLPEIERLEALKLAKKRKFLISQFATPIAEISSRFRIQAARRRPEPPADDMRDASCPQPKNRNRKGAAKPRDEHPRFLPDQSLR